MSGADCLLVKHELLQQHKDSLQALAMQLQYTASGDD